MDGRSKPELRAECLRLRMEGMSYSQIQKVTGAATGSLAHWLRGIGNTLNHVPTGGKKKDRGVESNLHQMAAGKELSRQTKAKIAEAAVLLRLIIHEYTPFGSVFDGDKTDWLVEVPGTSKVHKIQVKWAREGSSSPSIRLTCTQGHNHGVRYKPGAFDFIVGYDFFTDTAYVWSEAETLDHRQTLSICPDAAERWDKLRA